MDNSLRVGIDIGGTFTDFVIYHPESQKIETFKILSTPHNPAEAVLEGLEKISLQSLGANNRDWRLEIIHGSTVATNALLERKGARTAFISTRGFKDILQIGRQNRPALYDFFADPPPTLIPSELRFEVNERVDKDGDVLIPLDEKEVDLLVEEIKKQKISSVAICLLFSFANPTHEKLIADKLRAEGILVSVSSEILPEYREYERASTTAVNAYVSPALEKYLSFLESPPLLIGEGLGLRVMQSNGGSIRVDEAKRFGVRCILSGPAGGIIGCEYIGRKAFTTETTKRTENNKKDSVLSVNSVVKFLTFDMGGTSTDVSLIDKNPKVTTESNISGCPIKIPVLDIHTIGAGGGSIAYVDAGGALRVGPQSAGANPGPACYGRGETPTVTDANVVLGRLPVQHFLGGAMQLNKERARKAIKKISTQLNLSIEQTALGIIQIANAHMERALRVISVERGYDPRDFTLLSFGGAGGLHAVDLARGLGIPRVLVPPLASTLSAFGMLAADVVKDYTQTVMLGGDISFAQLEKIFNPLVERGRADLENESITEDRTAVERFVDMRYRGQSYELMIPFDENIISNFHQEHQRSYGYSNPNAAIEIVNVRVRAVGRVDAPPLQHHPLEDENPLHAQIETAPVIFEAGATQTPFYRAELLRAGNLINGSAVIIRNDTTILIGANDIARVDEFGNLIITVGATLVVAPVVSSPNKKGGDEPRPYENIYNPIKLEIFKHLFASVAEEMGTVLRKASYSPNIKERRDFSCALFDAKGRMIAQAAHIPVHLGAMPLSVEAAVQQFPDMQSGDVIILNDPFKGGTHLPDITMVSPVFVDNEITTETTKSTEKNNKDKKSSVNSVRSVVKNVLIGFVASRAHHADVGGMTPGSMPVAREIYQEGLIIPPIKLISAGKINQDMLDLILRNVRTPDERRGDLQAQIASNLRGAERLIEMASRYGADEIQEAEEQLIAYTERMTRKLIESLPNGSYSFTDFLDDDGITNDLIPIKVNITIKDDEAIVDFTGSAPQQQGSVNAVYAITLSAVYYVFRCLLNLDVPNNAGCLAPIRVIAPSGSIVNALAPSPVAGGNVETSQRIVDVLLGALAQACPDKVPAASQGTMNNLTIGGKVTLIPSPSPSKGEGNFAYYETIGGGMGARPNADGVSAIHSHMTNTLNTPAEAMEYAYPLRVMRYAVRENSGGDGRFKGGDGIVRDIQLMVDAQVTLLTERRKNPPYGLNGGGVGQCGENVLIRDGKETPLRGKGTVELKAGDVLSIRTPGGGGYGS